MILWLAVGIAVGLMIKTVQVRRWADKANEKPPDLLQGTEKFITELREAIVSQVLNYQPQLFDAIAKQRVILANQDRDPIAIFLNIDTFKYVLTATLKGDQLKQVDELCDVVLGLDIPVGHLGTLPIYVTPLLKEAPVFVAGGIQWTM